MTNWVAIMENVVTPQTCACAKLGGRVPVVKNALGYQDAKMDFVKTKLFSVFVKEMAQLGQGTIVIFVSDKLATYML